MNHFKCDLQARLLKFLSNDVIDSAFGNLNWITENIHYKIDISLKKERDSGHPRKAGGCKINAKITRSLSKQVVKKYG